MKMKLISGDEYDAFSRWRHLHHWKPHVIRKLKRKVWKRFRRDGKRDAARESGGQD